MAEQTQRPFNGLEGHLSGNMWCYVPILTAALSWPADRENNERFCVVYRCVGHLVFDCPQLVMNDKVTVTTFAISISIIFTVPKRSTKFSAALEYHNIQCKQTWCKQNIFPI